MSDKSSVCSMKSDHSLKSGSLLFWLGSSQKDTSRKKEENVLKPSVYLKMSKRRSKSLSIKRSNKKKTKSKSTSNTETIHSNMKCLNGNGLSIDCGSFLKTIDNNSYDIEYSADSSPSPTPISVDCYSPKHIIYDKEEEKINGITSYESITIIPPQQTPICPNYQSTKKDSVLSSSKWWIADCYYNDDDDYVYT